MSDCMLTHDRWAEAQRANKDRYVGAYQYSGYYLDAGETIKEGDFILTGVASHRLPISSDLKDVARHSGSVFRPCGIYVRELVRDGGVDLMTLKAFFDNFGENVPKTKPELLPCDGVVRVKLEKVEERKSNAMCRRYALCTFRVAENDLPAVVLTKSMPLEGNSKNGEPLVRNIVELISTLDGAREALDAPPSLLLGVLSARIGRMTYAQVRTVEFEGWRHTEIGYFVPKEKYDQAVSVGTHRRAPRLVGPAKVNTVHFHPNEVATIKQSTLPITEAEKRDIEATIGPPIWRLVHSSAAREICRHTDEVWIDGKWKVFESLTTAEMGRPGSFTVRRRVRMANKHDRYLDIGERFESDDRWENGEAVPKEWIDKPYGHARPTDEVVKVLRAFDPYEAHAELLFAMKVESQDRADQCTWDAPPEPRVEPTFQIQMQHPHAEDL